MKHGLGIVALLSTALQATTGLELGELLEVGFDRMYNVTATVSGSQFSINNNVICQVKYLDLPWAVLCNSTSDITAEQFNSGALTSFSSYAGIAIDGDSVQGLVNATEVSLYFGISIPKIGAFPGNEIALNDGAAFIVSPQKLLEEGFCLTDMFPDTPLYNLLKGILDAAKVDGCLSIKNITIDTSSLGASTALDFSWSLFGETKVFNLGQLVYSLEVSSGGASNRRLLEDSPVDENGNFNFGTYAKPDPTSAPTTMTPSSANGMQEAALLLATMLVAGM